MKIVRSFFGSPNPNLREDDIKVVYTSRKITIIQGEERLNLNPTAIKRLIDVLVENLHIPDVLADIQ